MRRLFLQPPVFISCHVCPGFHETDWAFAPFDDSVCIRRCQSISKGCCFHHQNCKLKYKCIKSLHKVIETQKESKGRLHNMTLCFIFVLSSSSELSERAAARSCYNKGQSSGALRSVRISFTCFSTRSDPRSRVSQIGRGSILIDEWRQDTARNTHVCLCCPRLQMHMY